jgi:hypothetical protein
MVCPRPVGISSVVRRDGAVASDALSLG